MMTRISVPALAFIAILLSAAIALGQDTKIEVHDGDTVKSVLERHAGKRVSLVVGTGPEISGVVVKVAGNVVHLSELSGREFFDAVVALDRVSAVIVRVRGR